MYDDLKNKIKEVVKEVYDLNIDDSAFVIEHPENEEFGDLSTNIALILAGMVKQAPYEIASTLSYKLKEKLVDMHADEDITKKYQSVTALQPGFINITYTTKWLKMLLVEMLAGSTCYREVDRWRNKKIMIEYTDPNPFKIFHVGHLMTNCIGESLSRIFEKAGANVKRANYQGDVGMHVAKSIWGWMHLMKKDSCTLAVLEKKHLEEKITYLGKAYTYGAAKYKENEQAKLEMENINFLVYKAAQECLAETESCEGTIDYGAYIDKGISADYENIKRLYITGRNWSLEYFETIYKRLGTNFDFYYFESLVGAYGYKFVTENLNKGVFEKDNGAIIFKGEPYGLHTRVFVNSKNLPVYEAKDIGLAFKKYQDYPYDLSIIVTGNEVDEYFKVVLKAMEKINPELSTRTRHIGHGMMRFKDRKMSSRTGDVISGVDLIDSVKTAVIGKMRISDKTVVDEADIEHTADKIAISSIKYSILKSGIGNNIAYDEDAAIKIVGNTGPYLLYTLARTGSVLDKIDNNKLILKNKQNFGTVNLVKQEENILRHIYKLSEAVELAADKLAPNLVASYLYELAQRYNAFYADIPILNTEDEDTKIFRLFVTKAVNKVLSDGLYLLGIPIVDKM